jgi:Laminin G domain
VYICLQVRISDGAWHTISVQRRKRLAQISVDGSAPAKGVADQGAVLLNTNGRLWIGNYYFLSIQFFFIKILFLQIYPLLFLTD